MDKIEWRSTTGQIAVPHLSVPTPQWGKDQNWAGRQRRDRPRRRPRQYWRHNKLSRQKYWTHLLFRRIKTWTPIFQKTREISKWSTKTQMRTSTQTTRYRHQQQVRLSLRRSRRVDQKGQIWGYLTLNSPTTNYTQHGQQHKQKSTKSTNRSIQLTVTSEFNNGIQQE